MNVLIQNALLISDLGGWIDMLLLKQLDNWWFEFVREDDKQWSVFEGRMSPAFAVLP